MTDENTQLVDAGAAQEAITPHPVLSIPDQEPQAQEVDVDFAAAFAAALQDILPTHWDVNHPSADLFQAARDVLDEYHTATS